MINEFYKEKSGKGHAKLNVGFYALFGNWMFKNHDKFLFYGHKVYVEKSEKMPVCFE